MRRRQRVTKGPGSRAAGIAPRWRLPTCASTTGAGHGPLDDALYEAYDQQPYIAATMVDTSVASDQ